MSEACRANSIGGASCDDEGAAAALGIAKWLCLAATPTFAIMALMTGVLGGAPMDMLCSAGHESLLSGMAQMYWDVLADERLSFGALAEAGLQPTKRSPSGLKKTSRA